ncbi:LLM class flavin-dependent oxidoreductase [Nonomuraea sp. AD125B]|uniref:LLM class flavin-dependent oxidoreductase n=1 Tax=Nonomuraea TaxID=83681 RepID=UPI0035295CB9
MIRLPLTFGSFNLPTFDPGADGPPDRMLARVQSLAVLAEDLGFHSVWLAEHHFQPHGGILSAPDVLLAALAARTRRIRLGLGVVQIPYHHPLSVAERVATLDQVSGGRLELGLGRAFLKCEYDGFGVPMEESRARFAENSEILLRALRGETFAHEGRFFRFPELRVEPRCLQRPHPPVWVAAATTPETFTWAGENAHHLMIAPLLSPDLASLAEKIGLYFAARERAGHDPATGRVLMNVHVHVDDTFDAAFDTAAPHVLRYVAETRAAGASTIASFKRDGVPRDFTHYPALGMRWGGFTPEDAADKGTIVVGAPDDCAAKLAELIDNLHVTTVAGTFDFGQPIETVERSMRLFAEKVVPQLTGEEAA